MLVFLFSETGMNFSVNTSAVEQSLWKQLAQSQTHLTTSSNGKGKTELDLAENSVFPNIQVNWAE